MAQSTVFDLLYDEYFPFRLYADYMLGRTPEELAAEYGLAEHWVEERLEAVRLCVQKQVRLNLVSPAGIPTRLVSTTKITSTQPIAQAV